MNAHTNTTTATRNAKSVKIGSPTLPGDKHETEYQKKAAPRRAAMRAVIDAGAAASYTLVQAAKSHLVAYTDRDTLVEPAFGAPDHPAFEAECVRLDEIEGELWLEFLRHPCRGLIDQNFKASYVQARPDGMSNLLEEAAEALIGSMRTAPQDFSGVGIGSMVYVAATAGTRSAEGLCVVKEVQGDLLVEDIVGGDGKTFRRDMITHWLEGVTIEGGVLGRVVTNDSNDTQLLDLAARFDAMRPAQKAAWEAIKPLAEEAFREDETLGSEPDWQTDREKTRAWRERRNAMPAHRKWEQAEAEYSKTLGTPVYMLACAMEQTKPNTLAGFTAKMRALVYNSEQAGGDDDDFEHRQLVRIAEEAAALPPQPPVSIVGGSSWNTDGPVMPYFDLTEYSVNQLLSLERVTYALAEHCNEFSECSLLRRKITEGEYAGRSEHTENGRLAARLTDWADWQRDMIVKEVEARQPQTADEAYRRCVERIRYAGDGDEAFEHIMAILAEGVAQERTLSKKAA